MRTTRGSTKLLLQHRVETATIQVISGAATSSGIGIRSYVDAMEGIAFFRKDNCREGLWSKSGSQSAFSLCFIAATCKTNPASES